MKVTVLLFGHLSDIARGGDIEIELPNGSHLRDLVAMLAEKYPRLNNIEKLCRFAVDEEYAGLDAVLTEDCVVAALPPMSGG